MTQYRSDFLNTIVARGQFHQCSDIERLDEALQPGFMGYIGYDLTATSLHVGNLAQIMLQRRLQQAGGRPIVLLGGGTTRIGDPSGRDETRQLLSEAAIAANRASIMGVFDKFLHFGDGPSDAVMVDNSDWLLDLNLVDFLRDVGRHFSVNRMLTMDSVRMRLEREQPLTFIEFNYMVLMAYDFVMLNRDRGCRLQMGGSDQWGNIIMGVELNRRMDGAETFALTQPLITTATGDKMGKTASGAVWLNADMTNPYDYWQFWRNTHDADVGRMLRIFTDLPLDEIERLEKLGGAEINHAKKVLADAATALCHGEAAAGEASETARKTFEEGSAGDALPTLRVAGPILLIDALVELQLVPSKAEARRRIGAGAAKINGVKVTDEKAVVPMEAKSVKISASNKSHGVLIRAS